MKWEWQKLGRVFAPDGTVQWMRSHASNPFADLRRANVFRLYFSSRNGCNQSVVGFVDVDIENPKEILKVSKTPVLQPGKVGLFDDSGVSLGCIVNYGGRKYLYYMGWNLGVTVPWRNSIGLAISHNNGNGFVRVSPAPLIDRHDVDPYSLSYPWVLRENGCWRLWYGSNLSWGESPEEMKHVIKFASSKDGRNWGRTGRICIGSENQTEIGFSRPCVMKHGNRYCMWYSYRHEAYRIGYAESDDGVEWIRKDDQVGIGPSKRGWDSECVCYCHVFEHKGDHYMLYAGNGYGKDGFGVAKGNPRA